MDIGISGRGRRHFGVVGGVVLAALASAALLFAGSSPAASGALARFTVGNVSPAGPQAGSPFTVDVTALDADGNPASGWVGATQCVVFSGPAQSPSGAEPAYPDHGSCPEHQSELTFDDTGKATAAITLFDATTPTLRVADGTASGSSTPFGEASFTVGPAAANHFSVA